MKTSKKLYITGLLLIVLPLIWQFSYIGFQLADMEKMQIAQVEFRWAFIPIYAQILGFILTIFARGIEQENKTTQRLPKQ